jgi:PAS domain S-box-containing protein
MLLAAAAQGDLRDLSAVMVALDAHAIVSITDATGVIQYVNDKFCQVSGHAREELIGQTHRVVKSGRHSREFYAEMWRTITGGHVWQGEIENRKKNGERYWVETTIMPILGSDGFPQRYVSIRTEITELRHLEERSERQRLLLEIVHAGTTQFMASADLGHAAEYILRGLIELTNSELGFTGEVNPGKAGAGFALHAANDAAPDADMTRAQNGGIAQRLDHASLDALCRRVIDSGRAVIAARARGDDLPPALETFLGVPVFDGSELVAVYGLANRPGGYDPSTAAVRADRVRFRQSVLNLVSNAIKYNRERGSVTITCLPAAERKVRVLVSDTGTGIPPERQRELFLPFHRLVDAHGGIEGTGIGLVITRRLVEAMGGTVGVESKPGVGSTFWIELPGCEPLRASQSTGGAEHDSPSSGRETLRTVLYIEDNPANLRLIEQVIQRRPGLRMLSAHEPRLGIELALAHMPDVILLDINLPHMGGYEVLRRLKAHPETAGIPVIAVTANAMERDIERGRKAGFRAYLTKPLDVRMFYAVLDEVLESARG